MKKIISFLFFLPIFGVFSILFLNPTVLFSRGDLTIPFIFSFQNIPILAFVSIFFSLYIILIWIAIKFSGILRSKQKQKMENEINRLKANMQDNQGPLLEEVKKGFQETIDKNLIEHTQIINTLKKEHEKIVSQLNYEIKILKETQETKEKNFLDGR